MGNRILVAVLSAAMLLAYMPVFPSYTAYGTEKGDAVNLVDQKSAVMDDSRFAESIFVEPGGDDNGDEDLKYRYSDRWFTGSSYVLNRHLAALSSYAALRAFSYEKAVAGGEETQATANGTEVNGLLTECGFQDVQANKYYDGDTEADSMGCVIGHKEILIGDKPYTLLAVFPASPKYGQEWAGNFTVGKGNLHQGFRAGRDEVLRFLKNYIGEHEIKGDVKLWTVGHSRFGAISNLVAGFVAGGGAGYLGELSVSPEDVYCYTFGTPAVIKASSATKKEALSVAGSRGEADARYLRDSAGESYTYDGSDGEELVDPAGKEYQGIRSCIADHDAVPKLPPEKWGFVRYGTRLPLTDGSAATKKRMLEAMKKFYPSFYKTYVSNGDEDKYGWKTFDFATLGFVDDALCDEYITQALMLEQRINDGLSNRAKTAEEYVDGGYEEALAAAAAMVMMCPQELLTGATKDMEGLLKAALFSYLTYSTQRLHADRGLDEKQAIGVSAEELVEFITGEKIDPETYTVDDFVGQLAKYVVDNADYVVVEKENSGAVDGAPADTGQYDNVDQVEELKFKSKTAEQVFSVIANGLMNGVPEQYRSYLSYIASGYKSDEPIDSENNKRAISKFVFAVLNSSAYGTGDKKNPGTPQEAHNFRCSIYAMINTFMGESEFSVLLKAMGTDEYNNPNGSANAADFLDVLLKYLAVEKDADGKIVKTYESLEEAADAYLCHVVDGASGYVLSTGLYEEDSPKYEAFCAYRTVLADKVKQIREAGMDLLFLRKDEDGKIKPFSTEENIRLVSTLAAQAQNLLYAHLMQSYDSWMKAQVTIHEDRAEAVSALRLLGKEYADQALSQDKLDIVVLKAIDQVRDAGTVKEIESILADAKTRTDELIKAKVEADIQAAAAAEWASRPIGITALILKKESYGYDGQIHKPEVLLVAAGDRLIGPENYDLSYSDEKSTDAGTYSVTVTGKGQFTGSESVEYTISKADNPMKAEAGSVTVKYASVSKKNKKIKGAKAIRVNDAKGKVTYALTSVKGNKFKKYFRVNGKSGNITVKKGLKKGTYKLGIKVKAAGDNNYNGATKAVKVTITVK